MSESRKEASEQDMTEKSPYVVPFHLTEQRSLTLENSYPRCPVTNPWVSQRHTYPPPLSLSVSPPQRAFGLQSKSKESNLPEVAQITLTNAVVSLDRL